MNDLEDMPPYQLGPTDGTIVARVLTGIISVYSGAMCVWDTVGLTMY